MLYLPKDYTVPEGVLDETGGMAGFDNDLVIRYLDRVVVEDDGYEVVFKAGVAVEIRAQMQNQSRKSQFLAL